MGSQLEGGSSPWWVNSVIKIGVPSAIALFLVWFLSTQVRDRLDAVDGKLNNHINMSTPLMDQNRQMLILLRQICVNSAPSNYERSQCLQ